MRNNTSISSPAFFNHNAYQVVRFVVVALFTSLALTACGGGGGGGDSESPTPPNNSTDNNPPTTNTGWPVGTTIPEVPALSGDANSSADLYYLFENSSGTTTPGGSTKYELRAVTTANPASPIMKIAEADARDPGSPRTAYAIPGGDVSATGKISNYHIARVLVRTGISNSQLAIEVFDTSTSPTPRADYLTDPLDQILSNLYIQSDLEHPDSTNILYKHNASTWYQMDVGGTTNSALNTNPESFTPIIPLMDGLTHKSLGWLLITKNAGGDYELLQYDTSGQVIGEVLDGSSNRVTNKYWAQGGAFTLGGTFKDGTTLIAGAITTPYSGPSIPGIPPGTPIIDGFQIYRFTPSTTAGQPGSITAITNSHGDPLIFGTMFDTLEQITNAAIVNGVLYFFDDSYTNLYRIDENGWKEVLTGLDYANNTLLRVGTHLTWRAYGPRPGSGANSVDTLVSYDTTTGTKTTLDEPNEIQLTSANRQQYIGQTWVEKVSAPFFGNIDGMVYYNRLRGIYVEDTLGTISVLGKDFRLEAVARMADGTGTPIIIPDAQWIAASTSGNGDITAQIRPVATEIPTPTTDSWNWGLTRNSMELGEVFLVQGDGFDTSKHSLSTSTDFQLKAISAANPTAGIMQLGTFDSTYHFEYRYIGLSAGMWIKDRELSAGPAHLIAYSDGNVECFVYYVNTRVKNSLKLVDSTTKDCTVVPGF